MILGIGIIQIKCGLYVIHLNFKMYLKYKYFLKLYRTILIINNELNSGFVSNMNEFSFVPFILLSLNNIVG